MGLRVHVNFLIIVPKMNEGLFMQIRQEASGGHSARSPYGYSKATCRERQIQLRVKLDHIIASIPVIFCIKRSAMPFGNLLSE